MSESADFNPGVWKGHDFASARANYDAHAGRSYDNAVRSGKKLSDLLEASLATQSKAPLRIRVDETGSMGGWPGTMFSKMPYLEIEGQEYLGESMEISFGAFNDAYTGVAYPIQARAFAKGLALKDRLKEIVLQGDGGGQMHESSELIALYDLHKVSMPNAIHPIRITITDEMPYDFVDREQAENIVGIKLQERLSTDKLFAELKRKGAEYIILKPYKEGVGDTDSDNTRIRKRWTELVGADHVVSLPDPNRVVDVIFGILAKETGRVNYFQDELTGRQKPDQVKTVLTALKTVHALPKPGASGSKHTGRSIMRRPGDKK